MRIVIVRGVVCDAGCCHFSEEAIITEICLGSLDYVSVECGRRLLELPTIVPTNGRSAERRSHFGRDHVQVEYPVFLAVAVARGLVSLPDRRRGKQRAGYKVFLL